MWVQARYLFKTRYTLIAIKFRTWSAPSTCHENPIATNSLFSLSKNNVLSTQESSSALQPEELQQQRHTVCFNLRLHCEGYQAGRGFYETKFCMRHLIQSLHKFKSVRASTEIWYVLKQFTIINCPAINRQSHTFVFALIYFMSPLLATVGKSFWLPWNNRLLLPRWKKPSDARDRDKAIWSLSVCNPVCSNHQKTRRNFC